MHDKVTTGMHIHRDYIWGENLKREKQGEKFI